MNDDVENIRKSELKRLAWKKVFRDQLKAVYMAFFLLSIFVLSFFIFSWLRKNGLLKEASIIFVCLIGLIAYGVLTWLAKEKAYRKLSGTNGSWTENVGRTPGVTKVNAEYKDGNIKWNVNPEKLDWSLSLNNPITSYMVKK